MTNKEYESLLNKFNSGTCSSEELAILNQIAENQLEKSNVYEFLDLNIEKKLWSQIMNQVKYNHSKIILKKIVWSSIAAIFIIASLLFYVFQYENRLNTYSASSTGISTKNNSSFKQRVILPDGSFVDLEKGSSIILDENFGKKNRSVQFFGQGFFKIKRNVKLPFLVHIGNLVTEVLGTSFRISQSNQNKTIEVSVKEGKVSVYTNDQTFSNKLSGVILTTNQKALFNPETKSIQEGLVDNPAIIETKSDKIILNFEEASLNHVFENLHKAYGIDIILLNPNLGNCVFTGELSGLEMFKQIELICSATSATYEIRGASVFIKGIGCN